MFEIVESIVGAVVNVVKAIGNIKFPKFPKLFGRNKDEEVPQMATGGIVRKPTLAVVGEEGPEAVVPLGGTGGPFDTIARSIGKSNKLLQTVVVNTSGSGAGGGGSIQSAVQAVSKAVVPMVRKTLARDIDFRNRRGDKLSSSDALLKIAKTGRSMEIATSILSAKVARLSPGERCWVCLGAWCRWSARHSLGT